MCRMIGFIVTCVLGILMLASSNGKKSYQDMTHIVFPGMPRHPSHKPFSLEIAHAGPLPGVKFVAMNNLALGEHTGTHIDAPYHFCESCLKIHEMPFEKLHGPAVVIDIREKVNQSTHWDVYLEKEDVLAWEEKYGEIPNGAIVIQNSGWGERWPNVAEFVGGTNASDLHSPGFSSGAARFLVEERNIIGIATDTVNCDSGADLEFPTHLVVQPLNIWCIEMAANVDKIPESGAEVFAMPMNVKNGTGAPIRMFAIMEEEEKKQMVDTCNAGKLLHYELLVVLLTLVLLQLMI